MRAIPTNMKSCKNAQRESERERGRRTYLYRAAHLLRERDMLTPNLKLREVVIFILLPRTLTELQI